jgi:cysteine desulfurase/selenocysteine lyase
LSFYFLRDADPAHRNAKSIELLDPYAKPDRDLARVDSFERDPRAESARQDFQPSKPPQPYDVETIRGDFPILRERVQGRPLVWLDNAATTQKPQVVIDRISEFYMRENSNIHRAAHTLAARATDAYEAARQSVRRFLNASSAEEIVFVRGTEGINLIAQTWGKRYVEAALDRSRISNVELHADRRLAERCGHRLRALPIATGDGDRRTFLRER